MNALTRPVNLSVCPTARHWVFIANAIATCTSMSESNHYIINRLFRRSFYVYPRNRGVPADSDMTAVNLHIPVPMHLRIIHLCTLVCGGHYSRKHLVKPWIYDNGRKLRPVMNTQNAV